MSQVDASLTVTQTSATITAVDGRLWWPADLLMTPDRIEPEGRSTPDAWLFADAAGSHFYGDRDHPYWGLTPISEREVVTFKAIDQLPPSTLVVANDGAFSIVPEPPVDAWMWHEASFDVRAATGAKLVAILHEHGLATPGHHALIVERRGFVAHMKFTAFDRTPRFVAERSYADQPTFNF